MSCFVMCYVWWYVSYHIIPGVDRQRVSLERTHLLKENPQFRCYDHIKKPLCIIYALPFFAQQTLFLVVFSAMTSHSMPSQRVMAETPRKRPRVPPNSATREVQG